MKRLDARFAALLITVHAVCRAAAPESLPADLNTSVTINVSAASSYEIPATLFGKFSENVGFNVYGGLWAQDLVNPSLEPISAVMRGGEYVPFDVTLMQRMSREELILPEMKDRIAYAWVPWNGKPDQYRLVDRALNTSYSQEISVSAGQPAPTGIRQAIYLPLHRQLKYRISCYTDTPDAPLVAQIGTVQDARLLGSADLGRSKQAATDGWHLRECELEVRDDVTTTGAPLWFCIGLKSPGRVLLDQVTLWAADEQEGFDPEVIEWLRDYGVTLLRFPGGNYVSGYRWKDDLVPLHKRSTTRNIAWNQPDPHHVGTDEYLRLCRLLDAEPLICVNAGNGTAEEAADWVEYCNGSTTTTWGRIRAERGRPEPYNVKYWEVGNELWGHWQVGHCTAEEYAVRYEKFARAMKARDASIRLIACGHFDMDWNRALLKRCPDLLQDLSVHLLIYNNANLSPVGSYLSQTAFSHSFYDLFKDIRREGARHGVDWRIAVTELMGVGADRNYLARPDAMTEALFFAGTFNSAVRSEGDVSMITYSALVNHGGGIRRDMGRVFGTPSFYARRALKPLTGGRPVACTTSAPMMISPEWKSWMGKERKPFPLVDVLPVAKGETLYVVLLNRHPDESAQVTINLPGVRLRRARMERLSGATFMAMNEPMAPTRVLPDSIEVPVTSAQLKLELQPHSFNLLTAD